MLFNSCKVELFGTSIYWFGIGETYTTTFSKDSSITVVSFWVVDLFNKYRFICSTENTKNELIIGFKKGPQT